MECDLRVLEDQLYNNILPVTFEGSEFRESSSVRMKLVCIFMCKVATLPLFLCKMKHDSLHIISSEVSNRVLLSKILDTKWIRIEQKTVSFSQDAS